MREAKVETVEMRAVVEPDVGQHKDEGKPMVQLIDPKFLLEVGQVMAFGAKKYAPNNFKKGIEYTRLAGSVLRHVLYFLSGENHDPESGLTHLAHAGASLMMLHWMWSNAAEMDDRSTP